MYKDKRVEKKKTVTMKRNLNPIFNESFAFDIPTEKLRETTIIITVMDKDKLSRNDVIGKVGGCGAAPGKDVSLKGAAGVVSECRAGQQEGEGVSLSVSSEKERIGRDLPLSVLPWVPQFRADLWKSRERRK